MKYSSKETNRNKNIQKLSINHKRCPNQWDWKMPWVTPYQPTLKIKTALKLAHVDKNITRSPRLFHTFSALSHYMTWKAVFHSAFDYSADWPLQIKLVWTTIDTGDQCKLPQNPSASWSLLLQFMKIGNNLIIVCHLDFTRISQRYLWRSAEWDSDGWGRATVGEGLWQG